MRQVEWVGGIVSLPTYVTGEGEPYRPEALFWMGADGHILGSTMAKPGELLATACDSLRSAIERPAAGRPHSPARIRVASPELAGVLRVGHPGIEIDCAPTPELDAMLAMIREHLAQDATTEPSYLSAGVAPDSIASFFRAAAALFRVEPWKLVPDDEKILSVTIDALGMREAAMSVVGQLGRSLGLIVFSGIDDFEAFLAAAQAMERGEELATPPHFALNFERGADLGAAARREVAEHRWVVAGADAYPWLTVIDEDLVARPPTAQEVTIAEAIALALPPVLSERKALLDAWGGGEPISRTLVVQTHAGELEVTLRAPYERERAQGSSPSVPSRPRPASSISMLAADSTTSSLRASTRRRTPRR